MTHPLTALIEHDGDRYFARCPEIQGCYTSGQTAEEARNHLLDAVGLHLAELKVEAPEPPLVVTGASSPKEEAAEGAIPWPRVTALRAIRPLVERKFWLGRSSGHHHLYVDDRGRRVTLPAQPDELVHPKVLASIARGLEVPATDFRQELA